MSFRRRSLEARREHWRRVENSLDWAWYEPRRPAVAVRGLGDRLRHIATARSYLSLGFVAWMALALFLQLKLVLQIFFMLTGFPLEPRGLAYSLPNYRISAGDFAALQSGAILADDNGRTVIDPNLDYVLVIDADIASEEEIERELDGVCFEAGSFWPRERFILIEYGAETTYQEVVEVLDQIYGLERRRACKAPPVRFVRGP